MLENRELYNQSLSFPKISEEEGKEENGEELDDLQHEQQQLGEEASGQKKEERHLINLELVLLIEDKLWSIQETLRTDHHMAHNLSTYCADYWDLLTSDENTLSRIDVSIRSYRAEVVQRRKNMKGSPAVPETRVHCRRSDTPVRTQA